MMRGQGWLVTVFFLPAFCCGCAPSDRNDDAGQEHRGFFSGPDKVVATYPSPDKKHVATLLYGRSSGPEGESQFLALSRYGEKLKTDRNGEVENKFVVFGDIAEDVDIRDIHGSSNRTVHIDGVCHDGSKPRGYPSLEQSDGITVKVFDCPGKWGAEAHDW